MSNKKETWKPISIDGKKPTVPYMISNHGRFGVLHDGKIEIRNFKPTAGNYRYNTRQQGQNKAIFLYKEVAKAFLKKPSKKHIFIIHHDHNYLNDHADNLSWATPEEHRAHTAYSPRAVLAREKKAIVKSAHSKVLDEKKVITLKKMIWDPERKMSFKQLAQKFGVSEMQIYRIKTGEFWFHVRAPHEPLHPKYKQNLSNIVYQEKRINKEIIEKKKSSALAKVLQKKRTAKKNDLQAEIDKRSKALTIVAARKRREKALKSARYQKLQEMVRTKKIKEEREKKARSASKSKNLRPAASSKKSKNYKVIKLSSNRSR